MRIEVESVSPELRIYPQVGEMAGRPEGGVKDPGTAGWPFEASQTLVSVGQAPSCRCRRDSASSVLRDVSSIWGRSRAHRLRQSPTRTPAIYRFRGSFSGRQICDGKVCGM